MCSERQVLSSPIRKSKKQKRNTPGAPFIYIVSSRASSKTFPSSHLTRHISKDQQKRQVAERSAKKGLSPVTIHSPRYGLVDRPTGAHPSPNQREPTRTRQGGSASQLLAPHDRRLRFSSPSPPLFHSPKRRPVRSEKLMGRTRSKKIPRFSPG